MKRAAALLALVPILSLSSCGSSSYLESLLAASGTDGFSVPGFLSDGGEGLLLMGFTRRNESGNEVYLSSNGNTELTYTEAGEFVRYRSCDPYWTLGGLRPLLNWKTHYFDDRSSLTNEELVNNYYWAYPAVFEEEGWEATDLAADASLRYEVPGLYIGNADLSATFWFGTSFTHSSGLVASYSANVLYYTVHQFEIATEEAGLLMSWPFE